MGHVIFLRHGQARNNAERILAGRTEGFPLTDAGVAQAGAAAELLSGMDVSAIYSSPVERARQTAEIVAKGGPLDVTVDERLVELDMGRFTGMSFEDILRDHGNVFAKFYGGDPEIARSGVETFAQVRERVLAMAGHAAARHPGGNVVLVTHMDPIKAMLSSVVDMSPDNLFELVIATASLNLFRHAGGRFSLSGINVMPMPRFDQEW